MVLPRRLAAIFSIPLLRNTTAGPLSASAAFLEPERGFSAFRTPSSPTFRRLFFGSAYVVASACPSGPRTRTARSADKSWTNSATTPWFADAAAIGSLATIWCQPGHYPGKTGPLDSSSPPGSRPARPVDVWVPRGPWPAPSGSAPLSLTPRPSPAFSPRSSLARTRSSTQPLSAPKLSFLFPSRT